MEQIDELELPLASVRLVPAGWRENELAFSQWWAPVQRNYGIATFVRRGGAGHMLHAVDVVDDALQLFGAYQMPASDALDVSPDDGWLAISLWRPQSTSAVGILDPSGDLLVVDFAGNESALALTWHGDHLFALIALDETRQELRVLDVEGVSVRDPVPVTVETCDSAWIQTDGETVVVVGHCGCQDHEVEIVHLDTSEVSKIMCPEGASVLAFDNESIWFEERSSDVVQRSINGERLCSFASPGQTLLEGAVVTDEQLIAFGLDGEGQTLFAISKDNGEARRLVTVEGDARLRDDGTILIGTETHVQLCRL